MYSSGSKSAPQYRPSPSRKTLRAPRPLTSGKNKSASIPSVCVRRCRTRIFSAAEGVDSRNSGKYVMTGSSRSTRPRSTCCRTRVVVRAFVMDPKKNSGVVEHRRAGDDVRHAMSHDDLAVVIDAGKITGHIVRVAIGGGLPAKVSRNSLECATSRSLTGATQPHQFVI